MKASTPVVLALLLLSGGVFAVYWFVYRGNPNPPWPFRNTYEIERTDYHPPAASPNDELADDLLDDKNPAFDAARVDRRPLGAKGEWLINNSAAVFRLDVPIIKPDVEPHLLTLHPSYKSAIDAHKGELLPTVNLIDGKAKQFDDGLYAALDQMYYKGLQGKLLGHVVLVKRIYEQAGKDSPAAPFLAAGLELAGVKVEVSDPSTKDRLLAEFNDNEVASKPIGFYTWNETLASCSRFLRFFQQKLGEPDLALIRALADALGKDKTLLADYHKAMAFYARLTNPRSCLTCADVVTQPTLDGSTLHRMSQEKQVAHATVALFPPSTSKEGVLFEKLFPFGLPPHAELMRELVRRIRSGEIDLKPKSNSGWYDHQVFALETLLLPEKGDERAKLLLTKSYKKRMLEAFQALVTKRRETHVRNGFEYVGARIGLPPPLDTVKPRLRVEPCPSYFLRTARAYTFVANFLEAVLDKETLAELHGLKQGGERTPGLHAELQQMRDLFYGLYLISAEDIGLKPELAKDENVDPERCTKWATDWLLRALDDPDLAIDTRVSVPIYVDPGRKIVRLWATLGVRLTRLHVSYARPPQLKPANGSADWKPAESHQLKAVEYLIPVDEFAEIELKGMRSLTRDELRAVCDREQTKARIIAALRR